MKKTLLALSITLTTPLITLAAGATGLQGYLTNVPLFIGKVLIPFLFGIAFLLFVINVIRYFVIEGSNEQGREKAKALATYSVAAFVFLIIFWGIVNMLTTSTGLSGAQLPVPDYIENQAFNNPTCDTGETSVCSESFGITVCRCE